MIKLKPALLQRGFVEEQTAPLQSASKNETAKKFRDWLQALSPRTLVVYSDGSRSTEGHAGYGYVVHRDGSTVLRDKGRLGPAEIFDAEAKGNEEADALAKAGASLPEPADNVPTLAHLRKIARQQPEEAFKAWWEASAPERYRDLRLKATTSCPSELALSRPLLPINRAIGKDFDKFVRLAKASSFFGGICPRH
ncbi:endonuclease/exonuclease/phosphatase [Hirsutella rhossiliensis]